MKRPFTVLVSVLLLAAMACTAEQRALLDQFNTTGEQNSAESTEPTAVAQALPTETPEFSQLALPTPLPTMWGPMGTLTAIAPLIATKEPDRTPYEIVYRGNPHFIEFHAWW